ncbi:MAG TPA: hypothetical protein VK939_17960 [Longimicrobiales bacterium]|nr:hypothetical protein [Longimicrobiales bacterium]
MFLFNGKQGDRRLIEQLEDLQYKAEHAHGPGGAATYWNQAGDLCLGAGRIAEGLNYYGRAIDTHVQADRFDAAAAVCQKVIRTAPTVVRARCTLTWLALGSGHEADARQHASRYVRAAEYARRDVLALLQLRRMVTVSETEELRTFIGEAMIELGDDTAADDLFGVLFRERNALLQPVVIAPEERWNTARQAVLQDPTHPGW